MDISIDGLRTQDVAGCDQILRRLPEWFALEAAIQEYSARLRDLPVFVARCSAAVVGFVALKSHGPSSIELYVMAVDPDYHRQGIGRALLHQAEAWCSAHGYRWLHVKTLGPSMPEPHYARTRQFYLAMGFEPLFESTRLWGPENPALVLIKHLH